MRYALVEQLVSRDVEMHVERERVANGSGSKSREGSASSRRWWWIGSALAGTAVLTTIGLLSAFGVIGKVIVG